MEILIVWEKHSWIMQNALKSNEWQRIWVFSTLKIEIQKDEPNNSANLQNWFPPRTQVSPLYCVEIFKVWEKYSWIMQRAFKCKEWWRIWVLKTFKIEIQRGNQIIQLFCRIGCPLEIRSPIINLLEFSTSEKSTPESWKMHWNLQNDKNDKEFWSLKLLKLKYRRGGQNNPAVS